MASDLSNGCLVRRAEVSWRDVEGEVIVLDHASSQYFAFNPVGSYLWSLLGDDGSSPKALADALVSRYPVASGKAGADVATFLADCRAKGLVEIESTGVERSGVDK